MNITEIRTAILTGTISNEDISSIIRAINQRRETDKHRAIVKTLEEVTIGNSVVLKNLKGKYNGLQGKVEDIKRVKAHIRINESEWRAGANRGKVVIVPLNCVQKLS